jgi:hypothetical protein
VRQEEGNWGEGRNFVLKIEKVWKSRQVFLLLLSDKPRQFEKRRDTVSFLSLSTKTKTNYDVTYLAYNCVLYESIQVLMSSTGDRRTPGNSERSVCKSLSRIP